MAVSEKICIIDYKAGNVFSVVNTLNALGANSYVSSNPEEIKNASKIIFPGVGSFEASMQELNKLELTELIKEQALSGKPFLGICVGMQVLFEHGTEHFKGDDPEHTIPGLGIFAGTVDKFASKDLKIPHMGWNQIASENGSIKSPIFNGLSADSNFYFVHSYKVDDKHRQANLERFPKLETIKTSYSENFISSIWNGENLFACQFHPEKSGSNGLKIIENFINL